MAAEKGGRECAVRIKSVQTGADGEAQAIEAKYSGRLFWREGVLFVLYEEDFGVKNLLKIEGTETGPLRVNLKKSGEASWEMAFEQGKSREAEYGTPYGSLAVNVETESVALARDLETISLQMLYALFIQGEKQADCRLEIEIR